MPVFLFFSLSNANCEIIFLMIFAEKVSESDQRFEGKEQRHFVFG